MISLLTAYTKNQRIIGAQGKIPWNLSTERNRFKQICAGKYVIIGRKSFEEIGKALSYCTLIVVSKSLKSVPEGCLLTPTLEAAIKTAEKKDTEILVAGGQQIYEQTLPLASRIYATEILEDFPGDAFFPKINNQEWEKTFCHAQEENDIKFEYITYERK